MARIFITRTVGRNIVEGTIRDLPETTIREIATRHGNDWYQRQQGNAVRRGMMAAAEGKTMVSQPGTRGRERKAVTA